MRVEMRSRALDAFLNVINPPPVTRRELGDLKVRIKIKGTINELKWRISLRFFAKDVEITAEILREQPPSFSRITPTYDEV